MTFNFKNKLINGDSLEELKKIPDESFDLVFADPPYNLQLKSELTRPDRSIVSAVKRQSGISLKVLKNMMILLTRG
jgi:site-specific DNA-methyltransferase (adenine-specific)/modification methylase